MLYDFSVHVYYFTFSFQKSQQQKISFQNKYLKIKQSTQLHKKRKQALGILQKMRIYYKDSTQKKEIVVDSRVLVLNRNFQPIHITNIQRAFSLLYLGSAQAMGPDFVLFDFPRWASLPPIPGERVIQTIHQTILVPQVIILKVYDRLPKTQVRLSRANIYARDDYQCQYCGMCPERVQLNLDHIIPRSRGGKTSWDNLVCCCIPCNLKKGNRTPAEAGMRLIRTPTRPRFNPQFRTTGAFPDSWMPFLHPSTEIPTN